MSLISIAGFQVPLEWAVAVSIGFLILFSLVIVLALRGGGGKKTGPQEERMAIVLPVDDNENIGVGKLLGGVLKTENKIIVEDPDAIDNEGQPKKFTVDITGLLPVKVLDLAKNILEIWGIFDRGEWTGFSFHSLLKNVKKRWDPLEADPQDIGDFYVGWGYLRKAFSQLLQSTSGKILVIGTAALVGYLLGMFTIVAHVGHL